MSKSREELIGAYKKSVEDDTGIAEAKTFIDKWMAPLVGWYTHGEIVKVGKPVYGYTEKICIGRIVFDLVYRGNWISMEHGNLQVSVSWDGFDGPLPMNDATAGQILYHEEQVWVAMFPTKEA